MAGAASGSLRLGTITGIVAFGAWSYFRPRMVIDDQSLGTVVCHCPPEGLLGGDQVWLTFDDGPGPETLRILELLNEFGFPATFFFVGETLAHFSDLETLNDLLEAGGHRVANHSWSHRNMCALAASEFDREIQRTQRLIEAVFGAKALPMFRPPFGYRSRCLLEHLDLCRLKTIGWSLNSLDFLNGDSHRIAERVERRVEPGQILLFHDGPVDRCKTVEALSLILDKLRREKIAGYQPPCL